MGEDFVNKPNIVGEKRLYASTLQESKGPQNDRRGNPLERSPYLLAKEIPL
ncbi:Hypothetical protein FKW44_008514, partial [Caligus rogercresseyi]